MALRHSLGLPLDALQLSLLTGPLYLEGATSLAGFDASGWLVCALRYDGGSFRQDATDLQRAPSGIGRAPVLSVTFGKQHWG
ncbi:MAG TPA: hypothetical protein VHP33_36515 [Polyangiaceae bacterium]|nr:hypothetical protein [Polyangiaceae bacterium]